MSDGDFITLQRRSLDSWLWDLPAEQTKVAITLMLMANWKPGQTFSAGLLVKVDRGQVMTSLESIARRARVSIRTVRTSLKNLEKCGFLTCKPTNRFSIITIVNYKREQPEGKKDRQADRQASDKAPTSQRQSTDNDRTREQGNKGTTNTTVSENSDSKPSEASKPTHSPTAKKTKPKPSDRAIKCTDYLRTKILGEYPNCAASKLKPSQLENWARAIDEIVALGAGHSFEDLQRVIPWVFSSENSGAFKYVIQSPTALADKWDRIQAKMVNQKSFTPSGQPKPEDPYERAAEQRTKAGQ